MVKKLHQTAEEEAAAPAGPSDSQFANTVKESAQQIWLAGLGAFSKAQAEGKVVFEALVKEGTTLQKKTQAAAGDKINEVTDRVNTLTSDVSSKAGAQWDKLESIFEDRVARALGKLGVPAAKEVDALSQRLDALSEKLARMGKTAAAKTAAKAAEEAEAATPRRSRKPADKPD